MDHWWLPLSPRPKDWASCVAFLPENSDKVMAMFTGRCFVFSAVLISVWTLGLTHQHFFYIWFSSNEYYDTMDSPSSPGREGVKQEGRGSQIVRQVESVQTPNSLLVLHIFSIPFRIGMMNDFQCPGDGLIRSFLPIVPWFSPTRHPETHAMVIGPGDWDPWALCFEDQFPCTRSGRDGSQLGPGMEKNQV